MKYIPILFSTPMVQAILEGNKKMTRRIIKPQPDHFHRDIIGKKMPYEKSDWDRLLPQIGDIEIKCPYGHPGDVLWVRETFFAYGWWIKNGITKTGKRKWKFIDFTTVDRDGKYHYECSKPASILRGHQNKMAWYKRSSLFMPKAACRTFLKVTSVRVERLYDISEQDAQMEGIISFSKDGGKNFKYGIPDKDGLPGGCDIGWPWHKWMNSAKTAFSVLWYDINGKESWDANPWVWVIAFERIEKPAAEHS